jgi:hypothetical protein
VLVTAAAGILPVLRWEIDSKNVGDRGKNLGDFKKHQSIKYNIFLPRDG